LQAAEMALRAARKFRPFTDAKIVENTSPKGTCNAE